MKLWAADSQCLPQPPKALARPVHFTKSSPYTGENVARTFDVATRSGILHRIWLLAVALLLLAGALGCGGEPQTAVTPTTQAQARATSPVPVLSIPIPVKEIRSDRDRTDSPQATDQDLETLVRGNNAFALDLYRALNDGEGNLFYSPFSISQALAMALAGARGEIESQMADTLHYRLPQSGLHPSFNALDQVLASRGSGQPVGAGRDAGPGWPAGAARHLLWRCAIHISRFSSISASRA